MPNGDVSYLWVLPHPGVVTDLTAAKELSITLREQLRVKKWAFPVLLDGQQKDSHLLLLEVVSPFPYLGIHHPVSASTFNTLTLKTDFLPSLVQQSRHLHRTAQFSAAQLNHHPAQVPPKQPTVSQNIKILQRF